MVFPEHKSGQNTSNAECKVQSGEVLESGGYLRILGVTPGSANSSNSTVMKTRYIILACALSAAVAAGIAQARSDDNGPRPVAGPKSTVELIFKTPPSGVLLKGDPTGREQTLIATLDTSSYRRIRFFTRTLNDEPTDAMVGAYEGELDAHLGILSAFQGSHIVDIPGTEISVRGTVSPEFEGVPIRMVVYGER